MANYEYGLIFEDEPLDKKVQKILDDCNDYVADEHTMVDVVFFDENQMKIDVGFNRDNCEDEISIKEEISKRITELGYGIEWDNYPDVDDFGTSYSYSAIVTF